MTMIGGPGGISGPKAPAGPSGPTELDEVTGDAPVEQAHGTARTGDIEALAPDGALAADVAAGRLTRQEAIDHLVEATAGPGLDATERAELRALLADLVTTDPYLGDLIGRI